MDKKTMLINAVLDQSKKTGFLEMMVDFMQGNESDEHKMKAMFNIFESTKAKWPPMSKDGSVKPQCKQGCAYCCHLNVDVIKPEMKFIWDKVTKYLTPEQLDAVKAQARINYDTKHVLHFEERLNTRCPCPFLDKKTNACSIYEDRPLACRGMYSGNLQNCIDGMQGETQNIFWGATYMICDDIMAGAALGLTILEEYWDDVQDKVTTQLETGILLQDDPNIEEHGI